MRPLREESRLELTFEVWSTAIHDTPFRLTYSLFGRNHEATVCENRSLEDINPAGPRLNSHTNTIDTPGLRDWDLDTPWLYELYGVIRRPRPAPPQGADQPSLRSTPTETQRL